VLPPALRRTPRLGRGADRRASELGDRQASGGTGLPRGRADATAGSGGCVMRVIDMECSVPKLGAETAHADAPPAGTTADRPAGYGMANYERIFRSRQGGGDARPKTELAAFVDQLARAGIVRAVPFGASNDEVAELLREHPDRFLGLARISGLEGMRGVRELERRVREEKFRALGVSALVDGIPASDRRYYPLYAKAI